MSFKCVQSQNAKFIVLRQTLPKNEMIDPSALLHPIVCPFKVSTNRRDTEIQESKQQIICRTIKVFKLFWRWRHLLSVFSGAECSRPCFHCSSTPNSGLALRLTRGAVWTHRGMLHLHVKEPRRFVPCTIHLLNFPTSCCCPFSNRASSHS